MHRKTATMASDPNTNNEIEALQHHIDHESNDVIFAKKLRNSFNDDDESSNCNNHADYQLTNEMQKLRSEIEHWKKFLTLANSSVFLFSVVIIVLYFTTDIFPTEPKIQQLNATEIFENMSNMCLNTTIMESNDFESYMACAGFCSNISPCCNIDDDDVDQMKNITTTINSATPFAVNDSSVLCERSYDDDSNKNVYTSHYPKQQCNQTCKPINTTYTNHFAKYIQFICDVERIKADSAAYELCESQCKYFDCCFSLDDDASCLGDSGSFCESFFDSCIHVHESAAMFGYGTGPQIITTIDPAD